MLTLPTSCAALVAVVFAVCLSWTPIAVSFHWLLTNGTTESLPLHLLFSSHAKLALCLATTMVTTV